MTLPDNAPARKPRRLGLLIPWSLAGFFVLAWCAGWFWLEHKTVRRMDAARASIEKAGWRFDWSRREVSGFPFRLNVDLTDARWGETSGWTIAAPVLKAQAYVSSTDHWVLVAPDGVMITRPRSGPIKVSADVLRGSLSHLDGQPPSISLEAINLSFLTPPGGTSFWARSATEFHFHTKSGPNDQGAVYVELDRTVPVFTSSGGAETYIYDAVYDHAGALRGRDIPRAFASWRQAGGMANVRRSRPDGPSLARLLADIEIDADDRPAGIASSRP